MLNGFSYIMPKHDFYLKNGFADVTVLPRIAWGDQTFGTGYKERTKKIKNHFKNEFDKYLQNPKQVDYAFDPLLGIYRYKGPVLEWYFRIKWRFEKKSLVQGDKQNLTTKRVFSLLYFYIKHFLVSNK